MAYLGHPYLMQDRSNNHQNYIMALKFFILLPTITLDDPYRITHTTETATCTMSYCF